MADPGELQRLLLGSGAVSPEKAAAWYVLPPPPAPVPSDLAHSTIEDLLNGEVVSYVMASPGQVPEHVLPQLSKELRALDAVLARMGVGDAAAFAEPICTRLDNIPTKAFPIDAAERVLRPSSAGPAQQVEVLGLSLLILVRCVGVEAITSRELLSLSNGDLATAVALATAAMSSPGTPPIAHLPVRIWQVLYDLSAPQRAAELAMGLDQGGAASLNDTPIADLLALHVAHAHRFALCLAQCRTVEAFCTCAEPAAQRAAMIVAFLRAVHNVVASQNLWEAGRVLGRQLAALWPRVGFRLLAPHLRRLLAAAEGGSKGAQRAAREFRRDLRTLGWLLQQCRELRQYAKPLVSEFAMRAARMDHAPETLAVAIGIAANSGALEEGGPLYAALDAVAGSRKAAVCDKFPAETNRLWVIREAWQAVEDLGYWPKEAAAAPEPDALATCADRHAGLQAAAHAAQDLAAIEHLAATPACFNFLDPECAAEDYWYRGWEQDDDRDSWCDWDDDRLYDRWSGDDDDWSGWWGPEYAEPSGPLGLLNVPAPPAPPASPYTAATAQLCAAPDAYRCALSGHLCSQPVRAPSGVLYERSLITAWLSWNKVCPVSGDPLVAAQLFEEAEAASGLVRWLADAGAASVAQ